MPMIQRLTKVGVCGIAALAASLVFVSAPGCQSAEEIKQRKGTQSYVAGVKAYQQNDIPLAREKLVEATTENGELVNARRMLGDLYRGGGDYTKALEQYEVLVRLDPYESGSYYRLGVAYQMLSRLREAQKSYAQSLKLDPDNGQSHMNLSLVYLALGDQDDAIWHSQKASELLPQSAEAQLNHGVVLDATGDLPGAEKAFLKSLELDSKSPSTLLNLGQNLLRQGKGKDAVEILTQLTVIADSAVARKRLADAYVQAGNLTAAAVNYDKSLSLDPNYYPAYNERGRLVISKYKAGLELDERLRSSAVADWRRSLELNPIQPRITALVQQWAKSGF